MTTTAPAARAAAIDIGTNSVLLLIAERRPSGLVALQERATITRLGQGVDRTRVLSPEACDRTLRCLDEYAALIRAHEVTQIDVVGTSAMRDAQGGDSFIAAARGLLGFAPRVIAGAEEARLTFEGALTGTGVSGPVVVVDVGGGSTEIVVGRTHADTAQVALSVSLDIGSVRLHERHLKGDLPTSRAVAELRADVRRALEGAPAPFLGATFVGVAGTMTTLAAMDAGLAVYDGRVVHGYRLGQQTISRFAETLVAEPAQVRRQRVGLDPARADVIAAGALIVDEVLRWAGADSLVVSDRGVRWGVVQRLLA